jgi:hypothetical protein
MTDQPNPSPDKKILVDEDWKSRVEAEKEALKEDDQKPTPAQSPPEPVEDHPLPPPTLVDLAGTLAMQAMIAMGIFANPLTGKAEVRIHHARHLIDTLDMLRKKTEGNRTAEETAALDQLLHELRLGFLAVQSNPASQP